MPDFALTPVITSSGLGRSPGEGNGYPLQYSCLKNSMERGALRATVHGVAKSRTGLSNSHTHTHTHKDIFPFETHTHTHKDIFPSDIKTRLLIGSLNRV